MYVCSYYETLTLIDILRYATVSSPCFSKFLLALNSADSKTYCRIFFFLDHDIHFRTIFKGSTLLVLKEFSKDW